MPRLCGRFCCELAGEIELIEPVCSDAPAHPPVAADRDRCLPFAFRGVAQPLVAAGPSAPSQLSGCGSVVAAIGAPGGLPLYALTGHT